jgi:hypothetical protein
MDAAAQNPRFFQPLEFFQETQSYEQYIRNPFQSDDIR